MFKLFSIVEEIDSPINGRIQVVKDLQGARIIAGGVSQSGWLVKSVWKKALKKILNSKLQITNVLILGLGGGSAAELVSEYWPEAKITGVDIDSKIVILGKKYLQLGNIPNLDIKITDADVWVKSKNGKFDLVLIDLFNGAKIPAKFYTDRFIKSVKKMLSLGGVAAFNHLYTFSEKEMALKLQRKLRENFITITSVLPEANIICLCFNK